MKSADEFAADFFEADIESCPDLPEMILGRRIRERDSEHAAALAKAEARCRVLEEACRKVLNAWRMNGLINSDSRQGTMILELLYSVLYEMEPIAEDTKLARAALEGK